MLLTKTKLYGQSSRILGFQIYEVISEVSAPNHRPQTRELEKPVELKTKSRRNQNKRPEHEMF